MSSSYGVAYARMPADGIPALEAAIKNARAVSRMNSPLGVLAFDPTLHSFAVIDAWDKRDNLPIWAEGPDFGMAFELAALSRAVGEVVAFHTIDEGLTQGFFGAWKDGTLVRDLQWMDGSWIRVEGEPQAWEAPLFSEANLQKMLELADDPEPVRAAFARKQLQENDHWPTPTELGSAIRTVLRAPAFGFQAGASRKDLVTRNREQDGKKSR